MQSAISWGVSSGVLLVLHRITTFFMDDSEGKLMAYHETCSTQSPPPMPKHNLLQCLNPVLGTKL